MSTVKEIDQEIDKPLVLKTFAPLLGTFYQVVCNLPKLVEIPRLEIRRRKGIGCICKIYVTFENQFEKEIGIWVKDDGNYFVLRHSPLVSSEILELSRETKSEEIRDYLMKAFK